MEWVSGIILIICLIWSWKVLNWLWLKPKKLEKLLREQGLKGNPYRLLVGDMKEYFKMEKEAKSKSMNLSDDITPRVSPYYNQSVRIHGMCTVFDKIYEYMLRNVINTHFSTHSL